MHESLAQGAGGAGEERVMQICMNPWLKVQEVLMRTECKYPGILGSRCSRCWCVSSDARMHESLAQGAGGAGVYRVVQGCRNPWLKVQEVLVCIE